jgi:FkbM family methyltransferase
MIKSRVLNTEILFQLFVKYIKPEIICDVGTMDASHSVLLRKISSSAQIIAFEANPYNYQKIISRGIAESNNIEVVHKAVSNNSNQLVFHVQKCTKNNEDQWKAGTSSILERREAVGDTEEVSVEAVRLDDFLNETGRPGKNTALWIDVEGAGFEVLEGIKNITDNVIFLQVEVESVEVWQGQKLKIDVQKLMSGYGFVEVGRGKHDKQHDLVYVNKYFLEKNSKKCSALVVLALTFYYVRKYGGHALSNMLLIPILGIWRKD